jgi:hypothetical protein
MMEKTVEIQLQELREHIAVEIERLIRDIVKPFVDGDDIR